MTLQVLPGTRIPPAFLPIDFVLPDGYSTRMDRTRVFLCFASEDLIAIWHWRKMTHEDLKRSVEEMATTHARLDRGTIWNLELEE